MAVELDIVNSPVDRELALEREKAAGRIRRDAKKAIEAEERGPVTLPKIATLRERLALPQQETPWRIHNWQPQGSRVICAAQFKTGKTTLMGNTIRSLVDGDKFLGRDPVIPVSGKVGLLDIEMGERQLDGWLGEQSIKNDDRVIVIPMRGRAASFDILDPAIRSEWAARLRELSVDYLILDCLRPVLDALGLDEKTEAGRFLVPFDALFSGSEDRRSSGRPPHEPHQRTIAGRLPDPRLARRRVAAHARRRQSGLPAIHHGVRAGRQYAGGAARVRRGHEAPDDCRRQPS